MLSVGKCSFDCDTLQSALDKLIEWSKKWLLRFNNDKCKVMHTGSGNKEYEYKMDSHPLTKTALEKDLGVFVSKDLKWNYHINYMLNKVRYDFLSNRIANHWNSLSQETVDSIDTNRFKNNIDASYFKD